MYRNVAGFAVGASANLRPHRPQRRRQAARLICSGDERRLLSDAQSLRPKKSLGGGRSPPPSCPAATPDPGSGARTPSPSSPRRRLRRPVHEPPPPELYRVRDPVGLGHLPKCLLATQDLQHHLSAFSLGVYRRRAMSTFFQTARFYPEQHRTRRPNVTMVGYPGSGGHIPTSTRSAGTRSVVGASTPPRTDDLLYKVSEALGVQANSEDARPDLHNPAEVQTCSAYDPMGSPKNIFLRLRGDQPRHILEHPTSLLLAPTQRDLDLEPRMLPRVECVEVAVDHQQAWCALDLLLRGSSPALVKNLPSSRLNVACEWSYERAFTLQLTCEALQACPQSVRELPLFLIKVFEE